MAGAGRFIRVGKKKFTAAEFEKAIESDLQQQAEEYAARTASAIAAELQTILDRLNANSANRGRGFLGVRYNAPLSEAEVVVEENKTGTGFNVYVDNKIFNILDSGSPGASTDEPMKFPQYFGRSTSPDSDQVGNPANVTSEPFWNTVTQVKGFAPRNFYINAAKRRREKPTRKSQSFFEKLLKLEDPQTFRFRFEPKHVTVRTIKRR